MQPRVLTPISVEMQRIDLKRLNNSDNYIVEAVGLANYSDAEGNITVVPKSLKYTLGNTGVDIAIKAMIRALSKSLANNLGLDSSE